MFMKVQRVIFCLLEKLEMFVNQKRNDSSTKMVPNLGTKSSNSAFFSYLKKKNMKQSKYHGPNRARCDLPFAQKNKWKLDLLRKLWFFVNIYDFLKFLKISFCVTKAVVATICFRSSFSRVSMKDLCLSFTMVCRFGVILANTNAWWNVLKHEGGTKSRFLGYQIGTLDG